MTSSLARNNKLFKKNILDEKYDEQLLASADGEVMVIDNYMLTRQTKKRPSKHFHMSLFPTTKRIAVYNAGTFLKKDAFAHMPISQISKISFLTYVKNEKIYCITEFIVPDESKYPSIVFKIDIDDVDTYDNYKLMLQQISDISKINITDYTDYKLMEKIGLIRVKKPIISDINPEEIKKQTFEANKKLMKKLKKLNDKTTK